MTLKERYNQVLMRLEADRPLAQSELHFGSTFQMLVAVVLSAQCTDKRVNLVTPALFAAYPDATAMAAATPEEVLRYIASVSYPNSKSRHLVELSRRLVQVYNGEVPDTMDDLLTLPGVGRKTANVVQAIAWNRPTMAVDTHVFRVANRIGLTNNSRTPLQTELTLTKHIPADKIPRAHHWLILHGRYVCQARKPLCSECCLTDVCKYYAKKNPKPTEKS